MTKNDEKTPEIDGNVFDHFFNPNVPLNLKLVFIAALVVYTLSPIDLMPEAILGPLGFADDAGAILIFSQIFSKFAERFLRQEQELAAPTQQTPNNLPPNTVPGQFTGQAQQQLPPSQQPHPREQAPHHSGTDALQDEWQERYVDERRGQADEQFDELLRRKPPPAPRDYSRNDPNA